MIVGINGAKRDITDVPSGINGAVRTASELWQGKNGATQKVWPSFPAPGKALDNYTWDEISQISSANLGESYFSVGDRKQITLNGTIGQLTLSNYSTYAFIIGFNHNSGREGSGRIHFQLAKTALSGGTDVCLCDSSYKSSGSSTAFRMNKSATAYGGWSSSYMRQNICGTSLSSYSDTIIGVIPASLRAVLKSVTKYTDNYGYGYGSESGYVTTTLDYFFLLSEYEVFGSITYANSYEANYQQQYAYYSAGNSKVKYKHNGTSTAAIWWLRSPVSDYGLSFMYVYTDGRVNYGEANNSFGFAPGFCV